MAKRITIIEEDDGGGYYDPGLPGALKSVFTVVLFVELIYLFIAVQGSVQKWQWLALLLAADVFFWIAMVDVFHSDFKGEGLLLRAIGKTLISAAIALGACLVVTKVLFPLLPAGLQNAIHALVRWFTTGTLGKLIFWVLKLALIAAGIIGSFIVLKKSMGALRYSRGKEKAVRVLEIVSSAVIILLMGRFLLLPLFGLFGQR